MPSVYSVASAHSSSQHHCQQAGEGDEAQGGAQSNGFSSEADERRAEEEAKVADGGDGGESGSRRHAGRAAGGAENHGNDGREAGPHERESG